MRLPEGEHHVQITTDPMEKVLLFYDEQLSQIQTHIFGNNLGQWEKEEIGNRVHYYCYGGDLNRATSETGCISIHKTAETTRIDIVRYRSEGGNTPCPFHIESQN
jgi:hypothetical protein